MSQKNLHLARRAFEVLHGGDYQEAARLFDADASWHNTAEFPGQRTYVGLQAMLGFRQPLYGISTGYWVDVERVVGGEDSVVLGIHSSGRGKVSGVPMDERWAVVVHLRDGKISRMDVHGDLSKALAAAGLRQ